MTEVLEYKSCAWSSQTSPYQETATQVSPALKC